jgi:deazaflavin-dependent oxidoreductase (nitroreductase family)
MRGSAQNALRLFTRVMRPLALRSAGKQRSSTSVVRHVGRRSGRTYQTPVIAARHDDSFVIALPYGHRTEWLKNVLDKGAATIVTNGHTYEVDRPEVIPMAEATAHFRPREQRMHRQFHVDSALQVRQRPETHQQQGRPDDAQRRNVVESPTAATRIAAVTRALLVVNSDSEPGTDETPCHACGWTFPRSRTGPHTQWASTLVDRKIGLIEVGIS